MAAIATGSLAVLSSLIDSLADIVASAITFVSVRISQQPPDRGHRFGHGKAESLSAMAQAALVAGSAVFVLIDAVRRLAIRQPLRVGRPGHRGHGLRDRSPPCCLVLFQRHVVRRTGSQAINADSVHYRADLLTNLTIIASLVMTQRFGWLWLDPLHGAGVALYLGWHACGIGHDGHPRADGP